MALLCLALVVPCDNKTLCFFLMLEHDFYRRSSVSNALLLTSVVDSSSLTSLLQGEWARGKICIFKFTIEQLN